MFFLVSCFFFFLSLLNSQICSKQTSFHVSISNFSILLVMGWIVCPSKGIEVLWRWGHFWPGLAGLVKIKSKENAFGTGTIWVCFKGRALGCPSPKTWLPEVSTLPLSSHSCPPPHRNSQTDTHSLSRGFLLNLVGRRCYNAMNVNFTGQGTRASWFVRSRSGSSPTDLESLHMR